MNPKPLKQWTYQELMAECAWHVIEAITKGEPILSTMYSIDTLITNWRKANKIKL